MATNTAAGTVREEKRFHGEFTSKFEPIFSEKFCKPLLEKMIPMSVHPNTISVVTNLIVWGTAILAYVAWMLEPWARTVALIGVAIGIVVGMTGDFLDGLQARRTGKASKLGEMMDHWLDAAAVPLVTATIVIGLQLPAWVGAPLHACNVMIFNGQLVLYHHTRRFIHPTDSGPGALIQTSLLFVAWAFLSYFLGAENFWARLLVLVVGVVGVYTEAKNMAFYHVRLKRLVVNHLPFVALCLSTIALRTFDIIDDVAFLLLIVFFSFRVNGRYVLFTILEKPYVGHDWVAATGLVLILLAHFFLVPFEILGFRVHTYLPYVLCFVLWIQNIIDFVRYYPVLKPAPTPS